MSKEQIDIIRDLLVEFDEMGFIPTTTVPHPDAYAIKWREELTKALEDYRKQSEIIMCKDCAVPHNKWTGCPKLNGLVTSPYFYCALAEPKMKGGAE